MSNNTTTETKNNKPRTHISCEMMYETYQTSARSVSFVDAARSWRVWKNNSWETIFHSFESYQSIILKMEEWQYRVSVNSIAFSFMYNPQRIPYIIYTHPSPFMMWLWHIHVGWVLNYSFSYISAFSFGWRGQTGHYHSFDTLAHHFCNFRNIMISSIIEAIFFLNYTLVSEYVFAVTNGPKHLFVDVPKVTAISRVLGNAACSFRNVSVSVLRGLTYIGDCRELWYIVSTEVIFW